MAKASELARVAPLYLGTPYKELDCQAFVEKCLSDIGICKNLPGSNAWFREMTWTGTPEECKRAFGCIPVGAFLFILEQDGKEPEKYKADGIGNASHIGIYTGMTGGQMVSIAEAAEDPNNPRDCNFGSGAIHSSSSRKKVCTSAFSGKSIRDGWNRVGLWDALTYDGVGPGSVPEQDDQKEEQHMTAVVNVPAGQTVKLRQKPSAKCSIYWEIPGGTQVDVEATTGQWSAVTAGGRKGYMMTKFLAPGKAPESGSAAVDEQTLSEIRGLVVAAEEAVMEVFKNLQANLLALLK